MTPDKCSRFASEFVFSHVANKSVVYFLYRQDALIYVGQSRGLLGRLHTHSVNKEDALFDKGHRFDRVFFVVVKDEDSPDDVEGAFIRFLRPKENGNAPRDRGRDLEMLVKYGFFAEENED
jgi:hypothetical protein